MKYLHETKTIFTPFNEYGSYVDFNETNNIIKIYSAYKTIKISDFVQLVEKVRNLAVDYVAQSSSTTQPDLLVAQYGRSEKYNGTTWSMACGDVPTEFKTLVEKKISNFPKIEQIILKNGDTIDCPHFWAVINGLYKGNGDLCGWAGDLVTFAADLNADPTLDFPSASFDSEDWRSDADAYAIYNTNSTNIAESIKAYYQNEITEQIRIANFITSDNILTRFNNSSNKLLLTVLMKKYSVSDITNAATKMQTYLDNNK